MTKTATKRLPTRPATAKARSNGPAVLLSDAEKLLGLTLDVARARHARLTPREVEVAGLMSTGKRNAQIAEEMGISPKTLDIHRANLMHKLEARTTADVANLVNLLRMADLAESFAR